MFYFPSPIFFFTASLCFQMSEPTANSAGAPPPKPKVRKFKIVSVSTNGGGNTVAAATSTAVAPSATPKSSKVISDETPVAAPTPVTSASTPSPSNSPAAPATAPRQRYTATTTTDNHQQRTYQAPPMMSPYGSPQQQYMVGNNNQWPVPPMPFMAMPTAQPWWQSTTSQQQQSNQYQQHAGSVSPPQRPQGGGINNNNKSPKQQHQRPHSPVRGGSGGKPPLQSNVIGTSVYIPQRNGMRIERSLEGASRDDLMQIIVELCFMNKSAAEYVESKAQLLSLCAPSVASLSRRSGGAAATSSNSAAASTTTMDVSENTPLRTNNPLVYDDDASFATPGSTMPLMGASPLGATGASIAATYGEMSPQLDDCQTPMQRRPTVNSSTDDDGSPLSNPSTASPGRQHNADSTTASPVVSRSSANTSVSSSSPDKPPREPASRRAFHADKLHPCMYVYGACRHPVSCPNAKLPFNLCLSWLRGVCHAGESCTMVHRLPDNCSEQVRLIHTLQEDDSHKGVLRSTPAIASRLFDTAKKLANQRNNSDAQHHNAVNSVDVSASTTPTEAPSPASTNNDLHSPHTIERDEKAQHPVNDATCPKQVETQQEVTPTTTTTNTASPTITVKMPVAVAPEAATVARTLDLNDH